MPEKVNLLQNLYIKNFALVEELRLDFTRDLNILTGETGAGKSIIIDALAMIVGGRANTEDVRSGTEKAILEAHFGTSPDHQIHVFLREHGFESQNGLLILRREIMRRGNNRCFVNDSVASVGLLKQIGNLLLDLHGQHEHYSLLQVETHLDILDSYGKLWELRNQVASGFAEISRLMDSLNRLVRSEREHKEKTDLYSFQLQEIVAVDPSLEEEAELDNEARVLENIETIFSLATRLYEKLYDADGSVIEMLESSRREFEQLGAIDNTFGEKALECESARIQVEETSKFLRDYLSGLEFNQDRLEEVRDRLGAFHLLKKKYGGSMEKVLNYRVRLEQHLEGVKNFESEKEKLVTAIQENSARFSVSCEKLSKERKRVSKDFEGAILAYLTNLGISQPKFEVRWVCNPSPDGLVSIGGKRFDADARGMENAEFFLSTNVGEDVKPLVKVASGGEVSRVMLAIKSVISSVDHICTFVFDEIDTGISGRIADVVGKSLKDLSQHHQILCITHLPQIAKYAETHFSVYKEVQGDRTVTRAKRLTREEQVLELAKLLGGEQVTDINIQSAKELIDH